MIETSLVPYKKLTDEFVLEQYKTSARLRGIIDTIVAQCDDVEIALWEILQALNLSDAIGPALDYLGAIVGVQRIPGETDENYRLRIVAGRSLSGLPTPEALRAIIKFVTGKERIGLFPDYPCGMYYVIDGNTSTDLSALEGESMTSGASLGRGTFLIGEPVDGPDIAEAYYIVNEDNGMPFVIDWRPVYSGFGLLTETGEQTLATEDNLTLLVE